MIWTPMTQPRDLMRLGRLAEEASELCGVASRCMVQGIDECEPKSGHPNRVWLQEEMADVLATMTLACEHFGLDLDEIRERAAGKLVKARSREPPGGDDG